MLQGPSNSNSNSNSNILFEYPYIKKKGDIFFYNLHIQRYTTFSYATKRYKGYVQSDQCMKYNQKCKENKAHPGSPLGAIIGQKIIFIDLGHEKVEKKRYNKQCQEKL